MIRKKILIYLLFPFWYSCMPQEDLPLPNMGEISDYFIECYCQPGQDIILNATRVVPLNGDMRYDFPPEMDVFVYTPDKTPLYYIFVNTSQEVTCRYQSEKNLLVTQGDTLYLDITTANRKKITAKTFIPKAVAIYSQNIAGNQASICFYTSTDPHQNYYIYTLEVKKQGEIIAQEVAYLDYSHYRNGELAEKSLSSSQIESATQVILTLKRITKANYNYQISQNAASSAVQGSITNPVPLKGNVHGALGIFTCYTEDQRTLSYR